ncbi:MAG: aldose 1-epimerase family protein [Bilifractor sp.]
MKDILKYCGSIQQMIYARPLIYQEGRAGGSHAIEVKCGDLLFHVMTDKCLDISDLSYKGMNMTFLSKPGLQGRNHYDTNGLEAQRSIMGGLFFTAGLENICAPCNIDGKDYPMHGRIRTTPAEHVSSDIVEKNGKLYVIISGEIREAELFGENMVLRRTITASLSDHSISVEDEIENQAFHDEPLMILYHCNFGYPFVNEHTQLSIPSCNTKGREAFSESHVDRCQIMDSPKDNEQEYVFIHDLCKDKNNNGNVLITNTEAHIGLLLSFSMTNMKYFMEWKSIASGDYVLGLEPSNSPVYGKEYAINNHTLQYLHPFEKIKNTLCFSIIEGEEHLINTNNIIRKIQEEQS